MDNKSLKENCAFDDIRLNNTKETVNIVKNWYQSVYFWNIAYSQATIAAIQNQVNQNLIGNNNVLPQVSLSSSATTTFNTSSEPLNRTQTENQENYKIPSLVRRFLAELFDMFYVQVFKIFILMMVINYTSLIAEDISTITDFLENLLDEDNLMISIEFLSIEILYFTISLVFETFCLYKYGYTPGKYLFKLKVVSCSQINDMPGSLIQVLPGNRMSLRLIVLRTILKGFSIILFPTILLFIAPAFMEYGQTWYDKLSESLVVQNNN